MNESRTDDFTQLRGAFDRPIAPSPTFAEHLREQIELELSAGERVSIDHGTNAPLRLQVSTSRVQTLTANGWQGALMTAAAIALVLAMVFGALRITTDRGRNNGDDPTALPGSAATPSSIASPTGIAEESSGASGMYEIGPIAADLSDELALYSNDAFLRGYLGDAAGLFGNILLKLDYAAQKWQALDVTSGKQLWVSPAWLEPAIQPVTDGERLFAFVNDAATAEFGLVALDLETGAMLWHVPDPTALGGESGGQGPIVANGRVYMHDGVQTFYAIEIESGEIAWQVTLGNDIAPYSTLYGTSEVMPNFVADSQYLYTLTGGQFLTALNLADGSVAWSKEIAARPEIGMPQTTLSVSPDTLYVASTELSVEFATPTDEYHFNDSFFAAYATATGQEKQRTTLAPPAISAPTVVNDRVLLVDTEGIHSYHVDDWSDRIGLDIGSGIDGQAVVATTGSRAFVVGRSGTDIIVMETDGVDIVQTWSTHGGEAADYWDVDRVHAWADGLMVETTFNLLYYIAPTTVSTPEATPDVGKPEPTAVATEPPADSLVDNGTFGPVSSNLSEAPELYSDSMLELTNSDSVDLFGDVHIRSNREQGTIEAIDVVSGSQLWASDTPVLSQIAGDASALYLVASTGSDDFGLMAIDLETGQERWFVADLSPGSGEVGVRGPLVSDGVVYVGDGESTFFAIAADTGAVLWKNDSAATTSDGFTSRTSAFAIDEESFFVATADGSLHAFDKATGGDLWTTRYATKEPSSDIESGIVAEGGAVYVSSSTWTYDEATPEAERVYSGFGGTAQAFDASSGAKLWESRIGTSFGDLAIVNDVLVIDAGSMFESVRLADGQVFAGIKYTTKLQTLGEIRVAGDVAYVTGLVDEDFLIFKIDGEEIIQLWRMPDAAADQPFVSFELFSWRNGLLIVTTSGDFYVIAPESEPSTPEANIIEPIATEATVEGGDNLPEPTVTPDVEVTSEASPSATPVTAEEIATPDVSGGEDLDAAWGGAGRTWNADIDVLAPDAELLPQGFEPQGSDAGRVYQSQVFGDLLVRYIVRSSPESSGIEAIEWETGEVRWYRKTEVRSGFASDGERVFIIETKEPQLGLTALDIESGAEVWNLAIGFNFDIGEPAASQSPIVSDGVVYFTDFNSKVGAADAATGELIWSSDSVVSLSDAASSTVDPDSYKPYPAANFALDDRHVYVVRVNRIVETLDRVTGEHVRSFELTLQSPDPTDNGEDRTFRTQDVDMVATDSAIIVIESLAGDEDSGQIGESAIWALDPETGTMKWSIRDAAVTGNVTIFESVLYVSFLPGSISGFDLDSGGKVKTLDVQMGANDKVAMSSTNDHLFVYIYNEDGYRLFQYGSNPGVQADAVYSLGFAGSSPIDYLPVPQYSGDELIVAAFRGTIWRLTPPWMMPIAT